MLAAALTAAQTLNALAQSDDKAGTTTNSRDFLLYRHPGYYQPEYEQASTFRGNITANSEIALELYWKPETDVEYAIVVYSIDPQDSARDQSTAIESIPIRIVS